MARKESDNKLEGGFVLGIRLQVGIDADIVLFFDKRFEPNHTKYNQHYTQKYKHIRLIFNQYFTTHLSQQIRIILSIKLIYNTFDWYLTEELFSKVYR
jgi:hypothetical protein